MPDVRLRCFQPFHAALGFLVVAFDLDENVRGAAVVGHLYAGHADQADARIAQFAFYQSFNLFAQGFAQSSTMMLDRTLLHDSP